MSVESASVAFLRRIWLGLSMGKTLRVDGVLPLDVASYLQNRKRKELADLEDRYGVTIHIQGDPSLSPGEGSLDFVRQDQPVQTKT